MVWELLSWGLAHHFPASLLRKSSILNPDLPSSMDQGQVQPNWPAECRPVAGAIPWRLERTIAHAASFTSFASLYVANSLQTGSNPASRGEERIPARHTRLPSHVLLFINPNVGIPQFSSLQIHLSYKVNVLSLLEGALLVLQADWQYFMWSGGSCGSVWQRKTMAAGSVHGAHLCHWSLAFREQLLCSHWNANKERKEIKYLQEEKWSFPTWYKFRGCIVATLCAPSYWKQFATECVHSCLEAYCLPTFQSKFICSTRSSMHENSDKNTDACNSPWPGLAALYCLLLRST